MTYPVKFTAHVLLTFAAFVAAYSLRRGLGIEWWLTDPNAALIVAWAALYGAIAGGIELMLKTERSAWSYTSISDIVRLVRSTVLTALIFLALIFISNRAISLPRSTLALSALLSLFFLVGVRVLWRLRTERSFRTVLLGLRSRTKDNRKSLVLVGAAGHASAYLKRRASEYQAIGIVSDDPRRVGQWIDSVPVIGRYAQLEALLQTEAMQPAGQVGVLFLEDPIADLGFEPELIGSLRRSGRPLLRQPNVTELRSGGDRLREISLEEFLPREPVKLDPAPIEALVTGRRVLVTGAGGSIGSEICRQLVALGCSHISLVDHSEYLLFEVDRGLVDIRRDAEKRSFLCDIRDSARLAEIFAVERPELVFHAAALKHVTLVEQNASEAVLTNVLGSWNVAEAARKSGVAQFVLISTDKAVDPTSFMGATKRLAESSLPLTADPMRYCAVRFGNVLGSAGSVVPIFRDQIERGGPVTVTHPDVERYFMTIPEAVQLVLHAAATSAASDDGRTRKFILEMGAPVRIQDLARQMIELSGRRPNVDIKIEFTGLKLGEKISEELIDRDEIATRVSTGLSEVSPKFPAQFLGASDIFRLEDLARSSGDAVRNEVIALVSRLRGASSEMTAEAAQ